MTTVPATHDYDSQFIRSDRSSVVERLLVRARAFGLDTTLARGVSPDSSAALSLRAHALIARNSRRELAREIRDVIRVAEQPRRLFDPRVPLCRRQIELERERLEEVADVLDGPDAVEPHGVARVQMLLRDGASPLYYAHTNGDLGASVQRTLDALEIDSGIHANA
jgi:hypothetical protein